MVMTMSWDRSFEDGVTTTFFIRKMSDSYESQDIHALTSLFTENPEIPIQFRLLFSAHERNWQSRTTQRNVHDSLLPILLYNVFHASLDCQHNELSFVL